MTVATANQLNKPVLKKGSTGETVKELQKLLLDYGMYVYLYSNGACAFPAGVEAIDGVFGSETEKAVKLFQGKMFLVQDGVVGNKTWQALYKGAPVDMPILKKGSTGSLVKQMQERIAIGGYNVGAIDGIFGSQTESAVRNLQQNTGLPVDGIVGDRTWFEISKIQTVFC
ncbi:peptidoglycan-binding protein [Rivularia sp. UHCC 0363]|uniref:peptidoglycan-binding domain-containing protein n=1 Tax=Rivularia sp. UHCC 0363 TaxID=3110244 RepID=UPI002B207B97|nr:peptidoglycan-binding protein [Rivularia sp. UHCC 0363]MEA5596236.1 peptidoglycan-binding protein [Rivularia sp. UHCC 0363]